MKPSGIQVSGFRVGQQAAFTMVEIAIALAVIGFALVAIIGVLPVGINVQKENREETIVNQEASVFLNAIRNGERGLNDLTNYIMVISNIWVEFSTNVSGSDMVTNLVRNGVDVYTNGPTGGSSVQSVPKPPTDFGLSSGQRIIGLLSTPTYTAAPGAGHFYSNHVVAYFRALSGGAAEKPPQTNENSLQLAFAYRLIPELAPMASPVVNEFTPGYHTNLHELRLSFRWPILPNGQLGNSRATFRTLAGGRFAVTNDTGQNLYFLQPSVFAAAQ